jgi:hypothetical protein
LWELKIDDKSGVPKGKPHRLTDWSGFWIGGSSATADGTHLALERGNSHGSVFVGELADKGDRLLDARRLTLDDYINVPFAWTADSRESIGARLSPDGAWVLLTAAQHRPARANTWSLFRVPVNGGPPQPLFDAVAMPDTFWCTNRTANFCAYPSQAEDGRSWLITAFDPAGGSRRELLRIPTEPGGNYQWGLSPDGAQLAIFESDWNTGQIRFIPVAGGEARTATVKGYVNLNSINWAQDSKSMFMGTSGPAGTTLLHVDLNGNARPIWQQP